MKPSSLPRSSRGSALAITILFTMICALLAFSVLRWSFTERRLNSRGALWLAARNAAEGVAEYGFAEVRNDFETNAAPGSYKPGAANALILPNTSVFAGSSVVTGALSTSNPYGMELIGGAVTPIPSNGNTYYVDPADYNNQFDPLKGKWVLRRDIVVIARASVKPPSGAPITHYMTETVSVRGAPLFAYAVFYNSDLELNPGPQMDITGPVHCNGNIWVAGESSSGLNFKGPVTCAGNIYHAWMSPNSAAQGSGGETLGQTPTTFLSTTGTQVNMKASSSNTSWKDSTMGASYGQSGAAAMTALITPAITTSFLQNAAATWGGNVQTSANGVLPYNPVSFNQVIDAAGDHPNPSVMIDPPNPPATTDTYYTGKEAVESEKRSMQAGLYIKVSVPSSGTPTISFYGPANSAPTGTAAANIGPNGGLLLNPPTNVNNAPSATTPPLITYLPFRRLKKTVTRTGVSGAYIYTNSYTVLNPDNSTDAARTTAAALTLPATSSSGSSGSTTTYSVYSDTSTGSYGYGMYDQRRGLATTTTSTSTPNSNGQIDLVQIDMRAVSALVTSMFAANTNNTTNSNAITYTDPVTHATKVWNNTNPVTSGIIPAVQTPGAELQPWNGAIYIDVEAPNSGTANQTTSVRLVNGIVANGSSLIPTDPANSTGVNGYGPNGIGLSLSTNAPLYVLGNFNADGNITSTSGNTPDDGKNGSLGNTSKESPVSLASDAITLLSPGWSDANSLNLSPNASGGVEIAAAFLTGYVSTSSTAMSGGAHNFPRFLEDWSGNTVAIRGSMVAMFASRIASQPWSTAYYSPPTRQWGFDNIFQNGVFPPYSPKVMSYRRVDFTDLTAAQYATMKAAMWP